jgi:hypothetical protein
MRQLETAVAFLRLGAVPLILRPPPLTPPREGEGNRRELWVQGDLALRGEVDVRGEALFEEFDEIGVHVEKVVGDIEDDRRLAL